MPGPSPPGQQRFARAPERVRSNGQLQRHEQQSDPLHRCPIACPGRHAHLHQRPNANGAATLTITATDDGGTANGGNDTSLPQNVTLTANAVNDAPSFLAGSDVLVDEDAGAQSIAGWASAISPGPADESGQTVGFIVTNDNPSLFAIQPSVASDGTFTYTSAPDANGLATLTITAIDDGGTANGGNDRSPPQSVTLTTNPVNDAPVFLGGLYTVVPALALV